MSDLLSPILYVMDDEVDAFWCFSALMETIASNFHRDQNGMHSQLLSLRKVRSSFWLLFGFPNFVVMPTIALQRHLIRWIKHQVTHLCFLQKVANCAFYLHVGL